MSSDIKYSKQQYEFVCSLIWGTVPVDRSWAEESSMFKSNAPVLLAKYPMLDKSFQEEMSKPWDNGQPNKFAVLNTWSEGAVVYRGSRRECEKYLSGANVYQMNYSKLIIQRTRGDTG